MVAHMLYHTAAASATLSNALRRGEAAALHPLMLGCARFLSSEVKRLAFSSVAMCVFSCKMKRKNNKRAGCLYFEPRAFQAPAFIQTCHRHSAPHLKIEDESVILMSYGRLHNRR